MPRPDARRALPSVEAVTAEVVASLDGSLPRSLVVECARRAVASARAALEHGEAAEPSAVVDAARAEAETMAAAFLQPVINATGVIVHTNLGRAPLSDDALRAAAAVARGYSNLEFRLPDGARGSRHEHAGMLLAQACGAEAGICVNNNAAAVLLALAALARGREVVVSRGELVEIGGGFRVPEVMAESGARLVEVGTTNRTRAADYQAAIGPATALLLKVHASNYRIEGFVESAPVADLAGLGPPVMFDAGSGLLDATTPWLDDGPPPWLAGEPGVRQALEDGAALVTFSGDKLLGGPQAGVVVGRLDLVERVSRHPLARAVRADKLTLAAMQNVALAYLSGDAGSLPLWRMATAPVEGLRDRAESLATDHVGLDVVALESIVGGGSLPGTTIPSAGVALRAAGGAADATAAVLRAAGVVGRVEDDRVVCDLRTVRPADDPLLAHALEVALAR